MQSLNLQPSNFELEAGMHRLSDAYLGRTIFMARSKAANTVIQAYSLGGRSTNSRDRVFEWEEGGFSTASPTKTPEDIAAVKDAALIYYQATIQKGGLHLVTNGAQTGPIANYMFHGDDLERAMQIAPNIGGVDLSSYEPDPNTTARINGAIDLGHTARAAFVLGHVFRAPDSSRPVYATYGARTIELLESGLGYVIQTYRGDTITEPLPAFTEAPYPVEIDGTAEEVAHRLWETLNKDTKVAVLAQTIDTETAEITGRFTKSIHDKQAS